MSSASTCCWLGGTNFHEIPINAPPGYSPGTGCV
jgi:hypothetical protein